MDVGGCRLSPEASGTAKVRIAGIDAM